MYSRTAMLRLPQVEDHYSRGYISFCIPLYLLCIFMFSYNRLLLLASAIEINLITIFV
jgi:hypothetical protein